MGVCETCEYRNNPIGHCCDEFKILLYKGADGKTKTVTYYRPEFYKIGMFRGKKGYEVRYFDSQYKCKELEEQVENLFVKDGLLSKKYKPKEISYSEIGTDPDILNLNESIFLARDQKHLKKVDKTVIEILKKAKRILTPKEFEVICGIYINCIRSIELAKKWNCSKPNISKIKKVALKKIKKFLDEKTWIKLKKVLFEG